MKEKLIKSDNPVPSLEKYNIYLKEPISYLKKLTENTGPRGFIITLVSGHKIHAYYDCPDDDIYDTKENLDKLFDALQNGVETNKEQPEIG
jgi:hypothetical protein